MNFDKAFESQSNRPVYTYRVPEKIIGEIRSVGLVELTVMETASITKMCRNDGIRLAFELAKKSLVEVNEKRIETASGETDRVWHTMPAKIRSLVVDAYGDIHNPPEGAAEDFLASREVRIG